MNVSKYMRPVETRECQQDITEHTGRSRDRLKTLV
jgi:hypothetical protein